MATGKNKQLRYARAYIDKYDLSGASRTFSSLDNGFSEVDMTGWSNAVKNYLSDALRMVGVRGYQTFLDDTALSAYTALRSTGGTTYPVTIALGGGAAPAIGDFAYLINGVQISTASNFDGGAAVLQTDLLPSATSLSAYTDNPCGKVLTPLTAFTVTANGASIDNAVLTSNGANANIHITVSDGGAWALKVQHSTNDSDWSDLITFTSDASATASEHKTVSGTVNRYLRFQATRTGGTFTAVVAIARN